MEAIASLILPALIITFILMVLWAVPVRLWVEAISAGVRLGITYLIGMRLRKVPPTAVVRPLIWATKAASSSASPTWRPTTSRGDGSTAW